MGGYIKRFIFLGIHVLPNIKSVVLKVMFYTINKLCLALT